MTRNFTFFFFFIILMQSRYPIYILGIVRKIVDNL